MCLLKVKFPLSVVTVLVPLVASFTLKSVDPVTANNPNFDGCECVSGNSSFYCCQPISVYRFSELVCVNVSSVDTQNVIPFTLSADGKSRLTDTYSEKAPQPYCIEFDNPGPVYTCLIFYNTTFTSTQVSGCLKLRVLVQAEIFIPLRCFNLSRPSDVKQEDDFTTNYIF
ncbi:uncharacterized protein [Pocillopora verrucosa]|uniref:DUF4773 domain-containing protein n=1 Tax=Pocillopora damicornis TaxID=46731 RepID=A0A3M6ULA6_POCDA|nr:uncharacterized protein LOC113677476 [Pocillopora damicornis]XP_058949824.1 uncharacterized protein LOC131777533 [Pocillopora verrucosa]RMX54446.1 hypothetical protein pdam_00018348 [Pocillopora damicornis]